MSNWNPHATDTLGLEWFAAAKGSLTLNARNVMAATSFEQSVAQATGTVWVPNIGIPTRKGVYVVEVFDGETAVIANPAVLTSLPNEDVGLDNWRTDAGSGSSIHDAIDDWPTLNTADYVHVEGAISEFSYRYDTGALSLTGKRVLALRLNYYGVIGAAGFLDVGMNIGGVDYLISQEAGPTSDPMLRTRTFYMNPATAKPWTISDVQAFDTSDEFWFRGATQIAWSTVRIYQAWLEVLVCDENRLAVGILDDRASALTAGTPTAPAWNSATMLTPTGGTWTKEAGGRHLYTARRLNDVGAITVPHLESVDGPPANANGWTPTLDANGCAIAMGGATGKITPFVQRTTAPADSVDGAPYALFVGAAVYASVTEQQEFSGAAADDYGVIRFLASNAAEPTADLLVRVKRRSDNVQLGGTATISTTEFAALDPEGNIGYRRVVLQLDPAATLAPATQYYVEFASDTPLARPWYVLAVSASGRGAVAGYSGTSDALTMGGSEYTDIDAMVTVSTIPDAVAGFTATLGAQDIDDSVCCTTTMDRADLAWTATALGATFLRYEIDRSENGGASWEQIATVTVESVDAWRDYEARRGIAARYRIRLVRTDLAVAPWAESSDVTKPATTSALFLASNYDPTLNVAYDYRPHRTYNFTEDEDVVLTPIHGRDYQLAFRPTEIRGVTAHYDLLVGVIDKNPPSGFAQAAFTPLRDIAHAAIPYVCVLDHYGNRLYATLRVPEGDHDETAQLYVSSIAAVEVAGSAYPVQVLTALGDTIMAEDDESILDESGGAILPEGD